MRLHIITIGQSVVHVYADRYSVSLVGSSYQFWIGDILVCEAPKEASVRQVQIWERLQTGKSDTRISIMRKDNHSGTRGDEVSRAGGQRRTAAQ